MSKRVYIVTVATFSSSCARQAHKNQIFPFFIRLIFCFKVLSPERSLQNLNGVGVCLDWVAVAWMHKKFVATQTSEPKGDARLAREHRYSREGRVGSGMAGLTFVWGQRASTEIKKMERCDLAKENEIPISRA